MNLIPFVGSNEDKVDEPDLRSNPFQEGGMMEEGLDKVQSPELCSNILKLMKS